MFEIFFSKNHAENVAEELVPDLLLFRKALYQIKASGQHLSFNIFWYFHLQQNKPYKFPDCWSWDKLNFDFLELGVVSRPHFVYDFSRKKFFVFYSIKWPNLFVWLPLLLEILGNMFFVIIYFPLDDYINFEGNLSFLMKPFSYMAKAKDFRTKIQTS